MKKAILDISVIEDLKAWTKNESKLVKRGFELVEDIHKNPFSSLGKPEPLKYHSQGFWYRRISDEHRLIYQASTSR